MKRKTAAIRVRFGVTLAVDDIAESLAVELSHEEMVELIVELDKGCADWGVTEKLYKHFAKEMEKLAKEDAAWAAADKAAGEAVR